MSESVTVNTTYAGVIDGLHTWHVSNADTGELIGINQSAITPCPGEGCTLDEVEPV